MNKPASPDRIIIGIDPGTNVMGYGILAVESRKPRVVAMGVLKLNKMETHYMRLHRIHERVLSLIGQYLPDELAIEAPFTGKTSSRCSNWDVPRAWPWRRP